MKNLVPDLIDELMIGTKRKLKSMNLSIDKRNEEILRKKLYKEFIKPSIDQSKTPTQIINEFLNQNLKLGFNLTPSSFGEEAHKLIIQWGIQKVKDINEQKSD
tara:strand:- start:241 stop:549 length:309 start_codon:yes stop_codon:yes gene_type:complete